MNELVQFLVMALCFMFDYIECALRYMLPSLTDYLPSLEGGNSDIKKMAFILAVMVFILGALKIISNARR